MEVSVTQQGLPFRMTGIQVSKLAGAGKFDLRGSPRLSLSLSPSFSFSFCFFFSLSLPLSLQLSDSLWHSSLLHLLSFVFPASPLYGDLLVNSILRSCDLLGWALKVLASLTDTARPERMHACKKKA